jgi:hypothetical protein
MAFSLACGVGSGGSPLSSSVILRLSIWTPPQQAWLYRGDSEDLDLKQALFALLVIASATPSALAQKEIPKASGHDQCPLGYVNTLGTTCVSPIYYEVAPTNGKACKSGWMNIGAGYCKKKTLGIF